VFVKCSPVPLNTTENPKEKEAVKLFFENAKRLTEYPVIFDIIHCLPNEISGLKLYFKDVMKSNEEMMKAAVESTDLAWDTFLSLCLPLCDHFQSVLNEEKKCANETDFVQLRSTRNLTMREVNPQILQLVDYWESAVSFITVAVQKRLEKHISQIIDYPQPCIKRFIDESKSKITKLQYLPAMYHGELLKTYLDIGNGSMYDMQEWRLRRYAGEPLLFSFVNDCCEALLVEDPNNLGFVGAQKAADECKSKEMNSWLKGIFDVLMFL